MSLTWTHYEINTILLHGTDNANKTMFKSGFLDNHTYIHDRFLRLSAAAGEVISYTDTTVILN